MFPYEFYKIMHLTGLILIFSGLVGLLTLKMAGAAIEGKVKSLVFIGHGVGMLLTLTGGFGLLARLGMVREMPNWVYAKIFIWLVFGGAIALVKRKGELGSKLFLAMVAVFISAAYIAIYKPF